MKPAGSTRWCSRKRTVSQPATAFRLLTWKTTSVSGKQRYASVFDRHLEHLGVWVNCIYWDDRYPRLLTLEDCHRMWAVGRRPRLRVIGDISCDPNGSVQCTVKATDPGNPVYVYDPVQQTAVDGVAGDGPVVMAVDILPAEIPREASDHFSEVLKDLLPALASADFSVPFEDLALPDALKRAMIVHRGQTHARLPLPGALRRRDQKFSVKLRILQMSPGNRLHVQVHREPLRRDVTPQTFYGSVTRLRWQKRTPGCRRRPGGFPDGPCARSRTGPAPFVFVAAGPGA